MLNEGNDNSGSNAGPPQPSGATKTPGITKIRNIGDGPPILRHLKKETGLGVDAMKYVKKHHPGDPLRQVTEYFDRFYLPAATGRKRAASHKTDLAYRVRLTTVVRKLAELNMPIQNLDEIGTKQVKALFKAFEKEGWSASWMANVNTVVRRFGIWIGKPDLCPRLPLLLEQPWSAQRRYASTDPKDWESKQVDIGMYMAKIELVSPVTAVQLELATEFGVRVQEFLMFRPNEAERGGHLYVKDGTKGGRPRLVPIETKSQRDILNRAKEIAANHPLGLMVAKRGLNLKQAINHFYNTVRKAGISRKALGITAHGLRHGYACRIYKQLTGADAPVLGGRFVDPIADKKARLDIAERLGHSRMAVVSAYIGSHRTFSRMKKENLDHLVQVLENDPTLTEMAMTAGFSQICVLGAPADGEPVNKGGIILIGYQAAPQQGQTQEEADAQALTAAGELAARAGSLLGVVGTTVRLSWVGSEIPTFELIGLGIMRAPATKTTSGNLAAAVALETGQVPEADPGMGA